MNTQAIAPNPTAAKARARMVRKRIGVWRMERLAWREWRADSSHWRGFVMSGGSAL